MYAYVNTFMFGQVIYNTRINPISFFSIAPPISDYLLGGKFHLENKIFYVKYLRKDKFNLSV